MKNIYMLLITSLSLHVACNKTDQKEPPLVYDTEHTGVNYPPPILPDYEDLPVVRPLTDPFAWSDGSGRSTRFEDWAKRRSEIKAEIEHYEIGQKPPKPENLTATYSKEDSLLTVEITENDRTLILTSKVIIPNGEGPFPAIIGIGRGLGSLPADIIDNRKIATVAFNFRQVMSHTQTRGSEPINELYPELIEMGAYSAWPWGVSRIIDGLELVADDIKIDLKHLAITGCSFAGKMALFSGAFDERIALTIAQEPGGGGAAAWRVSEGLGNVEKLGSTNFTWFKEDMRRFASSVSKLPLDHHELVAMIAPRAVLILGNPDYEWLADESGYVSTVAASKVWDAFGISDRIGFSIVGGHGHCRLPESQYPEVQAFIDKFLLGDSSANTLVRKHPFGDVNTSMWTDWWTGESTYPEPDTSNVESLFYEVECGEIGSDWVVEKDSDASGVTFAMIKNGMNSVEAAPSSTASQLNLTFNVTRDTTYYFFAKANCPSDQDDSFWMRIDDGEYRTINGLVTKGWQWVPMTEEVLTSGEHSITLTYREDGAMIDKIGITTYPYGPRELGEKPSENLCNPHHQMQ